MNEYRISYNPFSNDYISGGDSHSIALYNKGKQAQFEEYIRGIIVDNTLYLRLYYPFEDIEAISKTKLYQASSELLKGYTSDILERIQAEENINIKEIKYNVENDLLKGLKLVNI